MEHATADYPRDCRDGGPYPVPSDCTRRDSPEHGMQPIEDERVYMKSKPLRGMMLVLSLSLTVAGCTGWFPSRDGYEQMLQRWIGATSDELIGQWGVPSSEYDNKDGRKIIQFDKARSYTVSGGTKTEKVLVKDTYVDIDIPQPDTVETTWCKTIFHIGPDDRVESYYYDGPDCRAYRKQAD